MATSWIALIFRAGSITRPPLIRRSYLGAPNTRGIRENAAVVPATKKNCRLFSMITVPLKHEFQCKLQYAVVPGRNASDAANTIVLNLAEGSNAVGGSYGRAGIQVVRQVEGFSSQL